MFEHFPISRRQFVRGVAASSLGGLCFSRPTNATDGAQQVEPKGYVVSDSAAASEAGAEILRRGGNAVDAAVATALALAVTLPEAGNLGGGGFMLIRPGDEAEPVCIDYRETAPAKASATMFSPGKSRLGHKVVGVPGTPRGLELSHQRFGKLPWKTLVEPAVRLAAEGFPVGPRLAAELNQLLASAPDFAELQRVFGKPSGDWRPDDRLTQPELAGTLQQLAEHGVAAFYEGPIAEQIVAEMRRGGGLVTRADLASYQAKLRKPVRGTYREYEILGAPPPSSGGIATIEALNLLERFDLRRHDRWSGRTVHLLIEALRRAFCDRARWLGDPDFVGIPEQLLTKEYAERLAKGIDPQRATPSERLAQEIELRPEGTETTHFSVIDAQGMAVANTYTLEHSYGSRVVVRGAGFLLNNEMTDFNWQPGVTNRRGQIGTPANTIAPGKRMLSSQSPTLVLRDGHVALITGSPGGRTIISTVVGLLVNVLEYGMDLQAAVDAPRLHHGWFPDVVQFEGATQAAYADLLKDLRGRGHAIDDKPHRQGSANSIGIDPRTRNVYAVADRRRGGAAASE